MTVHSFSSDMSTPTTRMSMERSISIPERIAKPWKLPPPRTYIFVNASVVDPVNARVIPNQIVQISNGVIDSISSFIYTTEEATVIDLEGRYLCPGLIDCHVHIAAVPGGTTLSNFGEDDAQGALLRQPYVCGQMLARGFTSVRDTGGASLALKEAIDDDVFPGPRLFICGKALSQTGGHGDFRGSHVTTPPCCGSGEGLSVVADGVDEVTRATREQIRRGASFIKIMASGGVASPTDKLTSTQFTAAEVQAICEVAASCDTYVTAHVYTPRAIRHVIENGAGGIEHGNFLDEETADLMAKRGVWLTSNLVTYEAMGSDKYAGFLPPGNREKNQGMLEAGLESLRIAHEAGVTICHGSDLLGPLQEEQSREFAIRARVLDAATILRGATINAATMLGENDRLGQIKEGFAADLLVLNENPLEDIKVLSEPERWLLGVIKGGRVYVSRWDDLPEDVPRRMW